MYIFHIIYIYNYIYNLQLYIYVWWLIKLLLIKNIIIMIIINSCFNL